VPFIAALFTEAVREMCTFLSVAIFKWFRVLLNKKTTTSLL
jgi:hypothetical protein